MEVQQAGGPPPAASPQAAGLPPAGSTFGVEEEVHLVDPVTYRLTRSPALAEAVLRQESGPHLHAEITTTQLESATDQLKALLNDPQLMAALRDRATAAPAEADTTSEKE